MKSFDDGLALWVVKKWMNDRSILKREFTEIVDTSV